MNAEKELKPLEWPVQCKAEVAAWPEEIKQAIGHHLYLNQVNKPSSHTKHFTGGQGMSSENTPLYEVGVNSNGGYRVVFAVFPEKISVLGAFVKSTEQTPKRQVQIIAGRYKTALMERKGLDPHESTAFTASARSKRENGGSRRRE